MFTQYADVVTLEEFSAMICKGRASSVKILKEGKIDYRLLRGSYRISKQSIINYLLNEEEN